MKELDFSREEDDVVSDGGFLSSVQKKNLVNTFPAISQLCRAFLEQNELMSEWSSDDLSVLM